MPPECKCCVSSNRNEYERMRKEGKSFRELSRIAKGFKEDISHTAFARHFNPNHKTKEQRPVYVPPNKKRDRVGIIVDSYGDVM